MGATIEQGSRLPECGYDAVMFPQGVTVTETAFLALDAWESTHAALGLELVHAVVHHACFEHGTVQFFEIVVRDFRIHGGIDIPVLIHYLDMFNGEALQCTSWHDHGSLLDRGERNGLAGDANHNPGGSLLLAYYTFYSTGEISNFTSPNVLSIPLALEEQLLPVDCVVILFGFT